MNIQPISQNDILIFWDGFRALRYTIGDSRSAEEIASAQCVSVSDPNWQQEYDETRKLARERFRHEWRACQGWQHD